MYIHQMDISSAYLNGDLHDVVYMRQHEGFINEQHLQRVLRLHKNYMAWNVVEANGTKSWTSQYWKSGFSLP